MMEEECMVWNRARVSSQNTFSTTNAAELETTCEKVVGMLAKIWCGECREDDASVPNRKRIQSSSLG